MLYNLKSIRDTEVINQMVLLRADLDVPIEGSVIEDDSRLNAWYPTLQYLLENNAKVIIVGHLGRPKEQFTLQSQEFKADPKFSLNPVVNWLAEKMNVPPATEEKIGEFNGWQLSDSVFILENIRFYEEEEKNDPEFAQKLASLAQIFVNDAFATAHRAHASTEGVAHFLPSFAGLRVLQEVEVLSKVLENPERPLGIIIGGAKLETKLPLVEKMHNFADYVCVGGTIMGNEEMLLKVANQKTEHKSILLMANGVESKMDATIESIENFLQVLQDAKTIVWNGPMGQIEIEQWQRGTLALAEGLLKISAYTVIGGGDTLGFLKQKNLLSRFSFASVGGGAMLEFLAGERLPGLVALEQK
jgi:phosphoglycerate kinase